MSSPYTVEYVIEALKSIEVTQAGHCGSQQTSQITIRLPSIDGRSAVLRIDVADDGSRIEAIRMSSISACET